MSPFLFIFLLCLACYRALFSFGYSHVITASLVSAQAAFLWWLRLQFLTPNRVFVRGRQRPKTNPRPGASARNGETVKWGTEYLSATSATTHFLTVGTTGAGKTLLLNGLMNSVLSTLGQPRCDGLPRDRRALIYDAKSDLMGTLSTMATCRIVTLHPFDARGAAWDLARDITTPSAALQAAALLMPQERAGSSNPFFALAAQNLLRGVLLALMQCAGSRWTLRDVVLALRFEERLRLILGQTAEGRAILDQFFGMGEGLQGVRATLATKMAPFESIAAAWDTATDRVSLTEWMAGEFILMLGNDEATRTALDAINRVLFQRLSELILSGEETHTRQTWLFWDEVREAGRLEGLSRLMTKGRSKGACVVLGFQAIEGMREVYGPYLADEITGLCNNKAILRVESAASAQWGSDLFGPTEEIEQRHSRSHSQSERGFLPAFGRSRTLSEQRLTTPAVLPSEIMTLPPTGPENGLHGFFITRSRGAYRAHIPWNQLQLSQRNGRRAEADFIPRPARSQYLREWTPEDVQRLALPAGVLNSPAPPLYVVPGGAPLSPTTGSSATGNPALGNQAVGSPTAGNSATGSQATGNSVTGKRQLRSIRE